MSTDSEPRNIVNREEVRQVADRRSEASLDARLVRRLLLSLGDPPIEFELTWTGERVGSGRATEVVRIADRSTLFGLLRDTKIRFGDAYSAGLIDVEGDLVRFLVTVYGRLSRTEYRDSIASRMAGWLRRSRRNTLSGSRDNIHRHYDLGNDFYALWLGQTMAYTCAYYPTPAATLDEAQVAKMDHVCRKVRIGARDSVVEAGCGPR